MGAIYREGVGWAQPYWTPQGQSREYREIPIQVIFIGILDPLMGSPMSHVDFKKRECRMSLSLIFPNGTCHIKKKPMSHVTIIFFFFIISFIYTGLQFKLYNPYMSLSPMAKVKSKKCSWRPVDFRGKGP